MTFQDKLKTIAKMAPHNQQLFWDITDNPMSYTPYFIKNSGLPFMQEEQRDRGQFTQPIIDLYNELLDIYTDCMPKGEDGKIADPYSSEWKGK